MYNKVIVRKLFVTLSLQRLLNQYVSYMCVWDVKYQQIVLPPASRGNTSGQSAVAYIHNMYMCHNCLVCVINHTHSRSSRNKAPLHCAVTLCMIYHCNTLLLTVMILSHNGPTIFRVISCDARLAHPLYHLCTRCLKCNCERKVS